MNQKVTSNSIENEKNKFNTQEREFKNLISKLKEISATIALLKKKIVR